MGAVRAHFRPEFLNRVDEIILFHRLKREHMGQIVVIQLARLQKLLDERKITVEIDDAARTWLANRGYDPAYGARPLKRVIQKAVQDPLAEMILAGTLHTTGRSRRLPCSGGELMPLNGRRSKRPLEAPPGVLLRRGTAATRVDAGCAASARRSACARAGTQQALLTANWRSRGTWIEFGSTKSRLTSTSKCTCGPEESPVVPT